MRPRFRYRQVWLVSIGLLAGCGSVSDPDADRRAIERFVADPAKGDERSAQAAANRLNDAIGEAGTPRDRLILAAFFDAVGNPARALERLAQIPDDLPDAKIAAAARLSEGRIAFYRSRLARRAETALKSAIRLDPASHLAWLPLADLYDVQNRRSERDRCYARLDEASALDRNRLLNWTCDRKLDAETDEQAAVLKAITASDRSDLDSAIALSEDKIRRGDFAGAKAELVRIDAGKDPVAAQAISLRQAQIAADQGETDQAARSLTSIDPKSLNARNAGLYFRLRGRFAIQSRKYAEAESALRKALAAEPNDREAHQLLVQALRLDGRAKEATEISSRLTAIDRLEDLGQKVRASLRRDDAKTLREIAETAIELKRYDLARAWLRQLLARDPLNATIQQEIYRVDQLGKKASE